MSRSGYVDDCEDTWAMIRWRGAVKSAIRGKRGQAVLGEILEALDTLPVKRLASDSLVTNDGDYCTLGALGRARGLELEQIDPDDRETVANAFGMTEALAAEIMDLNDEWIDGWEIVEVEICGPVRPFAPDWGRHKRRVRVPDERAPEKRWQYMRDWVAKQLEA